MIKNNSMDNFKRYLIDFINFILIWTIMVFLFAIIFLGSRIELLSNFFKAFIPLAFFSLIFLLVWKIERNKLNKLKYKNMTEITLYLNYNYKFADRMIIFSLPILIIAIALARGGVEIYDIIQALVVVVILCVWHNIFFKKN